MNFSRRFKASVQPQFAEVLEDRTLLSAISIQSPTAIVAEQVHTASDCFTAMLADIQANEASQPQLEQDHTSIDAPSCANFNNRTPPNKATSTTLFPAPTPAEEVLQLQQQMLLQQQNESLVVTNAPTEKSLATVFEELGLGNTSNFWNSFNWEEDLTPAESVLNEPITPPPVNPEQLNTKPSTEGSALPKPDAVPMPEPVQETPKDVREELPLPAVEPYQSSYTAPITPASRLQKGWSRLKSWFVRA